jgi:hypothetical protein
MYGDKGVELVKEAVRAGDSLAPFNEDSVRYALGSIFFQWLWRDCLKVHKIEN